MAPLAVQPAEIPRASTALTATDRLGALGVRLGVRRHHYRVEPGLYRVGEPDRSAPIIVTANYKLTFDTVRSHLTGLDLWLLVLETRGVNVWCAAGKGTFGTEELVLRLLDSGAQSLVDHRTLILPQLGAPGVAAHVVRQATGFRAVYGPVRIGDLPAFLEAGMKATPRMRRVGFGMRDRLTVTGVELSVLWSPRALIAIAAISGLAALGILPWSTVLLLLAIAVGGVLAGGLLTPLALPWIPGRAFALKGVLPGLLVGLAIASTATGPAAAAQVAAVLGTATVASVTAMNYTGSSTYTSPSGVMREMRRAVPLQAAAGALALVAAIISVVW